MAKAMKKALSMKKAVATKGVRKTTKTKATDYVPGGKAREDKLMRMIRQNGKKLKAKYSAKGTRRKKTLQEISETESEKEETEEKPTQTRKPAGKGKANTAKKLKPGDKGEANTATDKKAPALKGHPTQKQWMNMTGDEQRAYLDKQKNPAQREYDSFHRAMLDATADAEILAQYKKLKSLKYKKGASVDKQAKLRLLCKTFLLAKRWDPETPWQTCVYQETKVRTTEKGVEWAKLGVPWGRMVGLHGGNEQLTMRELKKGEIKRIKNPNWASDGVKTLFVSPSLMGTFSTSLLVVLREFKTTKNQHI